MVRVLRRAVLVRWVGAFAGAGLWACAADDRAQRPLSGIEVTDAVGAKLIFVRSPTRVLSLVPAATSVIVALGGTAELVGRTDFDTASAVAHLPSVGGGLSPSLEVVISLDPDLVIRFAGDTDQETPDRLHDLGIPHFAVQPERIDDVRRMVTDIALILGRSQESATLLAALDGPLQDIRERVAGLAPLRTAFVMAGDPLWVAGSTTYVGELLELAGAVNVFGDLGVPWGPVSPETLVAREVDVLVVTEGTELDPRLTARARVAYVSANILLPGPGLGEAAREIAGALRPDVFR